MSGFWEIEASAGPAREGLVGGGAQLLVRVRLFDPGERECPRICVGMSELESHVYEHA